MKPGFGSTYVYKLICYFFTFSTKQIHYSWQRIPEFVEQIGCYNCSTSTFANHTMYQNITVTSVFFQKLKGVFKVIRYIISFRILGRNIQILTKFFMIFDVCSWGNGNNCFYVETYIIKYKYFIVVIFVKLNDNPRYIWLHAHQVHQIRSRYHGFVLSFMGCSFEYN